MGKLPTYRTDGFDEKDLHCSVPLSNGDVEICSGENRRGFWAVSRKPLSANSQKVLEQARDIARQTEQGLSSVHILLAFFVTPNSAERMLSDLGINEETLLAALQGSDHEREELPVIVEGRAAAFADSTGAEAIFCLHILAALAGLSDSVAYRLLERIGLPPRRVLRRALRYVEEGAPERWHNVSPQEDERITASFSALLDDEPLQHANDELDTAIQLPQVGEMTVQAPAVVRQRSEQRSGVARAVQTDAAAEAERRRGSPGRRAEDRLGTNGRRVDRSSDGPQSVKTSTETPFSLDEKTYEWLSRLGRNLSELAWTQGFDPVIGRDREIEETIDVLNKRRSNNPCLIGEPGVGKTAIVEGVVSKLVEDYRQDAKGDDRIVVQVDVGAILAGTHLRGSLAERLRGLQDEVKSAEGRVVIFIDEIHTLIGAGGGDGPQDAANELKAALARGEFPCIGATTFDEYRQYVETDAALERRFTSVYVDEPDVESTIRIVGAVSDRYAGHHKVDYTDEALEFAVRLGRRYLHERRDPDRTLSILDLAGAVARRSGGSVDRAAVAEVISRTAKVPVEHLLVDNPERYLQMEQWLGERLVGQSHVLSAVAETIRRNLAGFAGHQPIGSFLFLGPTGVGKTEAVKALAQFLFGSRDAMIRFDMSEFLESHSVARLIGAPPGYVGHQDGGQLTDKIRRRPYQVVLFDEIEKSHRDVWNVLLQILDEGRLSDGKGRVVDFSNTLVVMTSNLGADAFRGDERRIGFAGAGAIDSEVMDRKALAAGQKAFPPELWNRIETRLVFRPLARAEIHRIARLLVAERSTLLETERSISFTASDEAIDYLIERGGFDPELGARPMRQAIAREFESGLAQRILSSDFVAGDQVVISLDKSGAGLVFEALPSPGLLPADASESSQVEV